MKRSLRILCLAMALLLCGGLLAACSDGPTESGAESSADNTSGTTSESLAGEFTDEKGNYIGNEKQLDLNAEEEEEPKKQEENVLQMKM